MLGGGDSISAHVAGLFTMEHRNSCHAAHWAPDGSKVRAKTMGCNKQ